MTRKKYIRPKGQRNKWLMKQAPAVFEALSVGTDMTIDKLAAATNIHPTTIKGVIAEARYAGHKIYTVQCGAKGTTTYELAGVNNV